MQNHQRAAQRHARREQARQQPREIFQFLCRNFFGREIEGNFPRPSSPARPRRLWRAFAADFFGEVHRAQAELSICRSASGRPAASSTPSAILPSDCKAL